MIPSQEFCLKTSVSFIKFWKKIYEYLISDANVKEKLKTLFVKKYTKDENFNKKVKMGEFEEPMSKKIHFLKFNYKYL